MTELRPLTRADVIPLIDLSVRPDQSDFVAPNAVTMAQAVFEPGSEIYGLWDGATPVGLLAIIDMAHPDADPDDGDDPDGIYIWRLMVAADHQRRGHGTAALAFAIDLARARRRAHVTISAVAEEGSAIPLYERFGFRRTGRIVEDEVELLLRLRPEAAPGA